MRDLPLAVAILMLLAVAPAAAQIASTPVITGLERPVRLVAPAGDDRLFVVEKTGRIRVYDPDGTARGIFLDLSSLITAAGSEQGLLGLAFAPDYATSGRFYVNYTNPLGDTRIVRYRVGVDPDRADAASAEILLSVDQPFTNHNAGHLDFGPDGMLYIGLGDGGGAGDPGDRAQDPQELLGKMLRIDVSDVAGYAVPPDNPFVGQAPRDEIWAVGLRNPWCFDFDAATGDLYIADVGQDILEEINVLPASSAGGENLGWRLMEGTLCFNPAVGCDDGTLTLPVWAYDHLAGCSISGGYVYRGTAIPAIRGHYFFADYCTDFVMSITWDRESGMASSTDWTAILSPPGGFSAITAFGQDGHGELYVLEYNRGIAHRIIPAAASGALPAARVALAQNTPNPFNPRTEIAYDLAAAGPVSLRVYGLAGRLVASLVDEVRPAGAHRAVWRGTDDRGRPVASGVYLYELRQGGTVLTRKMILAR